MAERGLNAVRFAADDTNVDPISGPRADHAPLHSHGWAEPGGALEPARALRGVARPGAILVAGVIFAGAVLALIGLWSRAGSGPALDGSSMLPSTCIALVALAAVASTYRLEHRTRPALAPSRQPVSTPTSVRALARANAAHMAEVSHIRIIESGVCLEARALPDQGSLHGRSAS